MIIITPSRRRRQRGRVPECVPKSLDNCEGILGQPADVREGTKGHGRLGIRESWIGLLRALSARADRGLSLRIGLQSCKPKPLFTSFDRWKREEIRRSSSLDPGMASGDARRSEDEGSVSIT